MKNLYLKRRFYVILLGIITLFVCSYLWSPLFLLAQFFLFSFLLVVVWEVLWLRKMSKRVHVKRQLEEKLSLGNHHKISYDLQWDEDSRGIQVKIADQYPQQLQIREEGIAVIANEKTHYTIRPTVRGVYQFGDLTLLLSRRFPGMVFWKKRVRQEMTCQVYPNIIEMKQYDLKIFSKTASRYGIRNIRKLGINDEFEQIRAFQEGDHIKTINWKASSRKGELLVNQYQDTRSQHIYVIIDKGRTMEMPFHGMSLMDYSINSALAISNIVLKKNDKIGLITFGKEVENVLLSDSKRNRLAVVLETLYHQQTTFSESNFEALYYTIRNHLNGRSVLFLFSNFLSRAEMDRNLKYLRAISKRHLLVLIAFENEELVVESRKEVRNLPDIYDQTIAMEMVYEKREILTQLRNLGIQTILTDPEKLSFDVINKYLEIKSKRMK